MLAAGVSIALGSAPQAVAQDEAIEEIIVTGSHIRRTEYDSRAPIQIVDAATFDLIGAVQPVEMLKELTINSGSSIYNETGGQGRSQFNIRGLGVGSTLTLLNGKRIGDSTGADETGALFVDINQFPLAMVERIEVLTDGASATYGSQAVAGVVNIITRKGFEGLEVSGGYSTSSIDAWHMNVAAGSALDRGQINLYGTYYEQSSNVRSDYDWMWDRLIGQGDISRSRFLSGTGSPGSYRRAVLDPATGEATDVPGTRNHPDPDCEAAGGVFLKPEDRFGRQDNTCRYHFVDQVSVIADERRIQLFAEFDWNLTDNALYYAEASYSGGVIEADTGALNFTAGRAEDGGITVLPSHPFNFFVEDPADPGGLIWIDPGTWDPAIHTAATLRMIARPLGAEVDNSELTVQRRVDRDFTRIMNGIEFQLPRDWYLDVSYVWSSSESNRKAPHFWRPDEYQDLIRSGEWNPFGTRLSDPGLVSPKDAADTAACANAREGVCTAANSPTTQEKFDAYSVDNWRSTEQVIDMVASGEAFSIGDMPVAVAVGGQYRDSALDRVTDSARGLPPFRPRQDVLAFFAEAIVSINDLAEIQLAVRNEDYGGGVSTTDPKFSVEITPMDWLAFRGSWGTSFQAPSMRQTAVVVSDEFLDDPASPTGPGGSLICNNIGLNISTNIVIQGGPDLGPQDSENLSLGVVVQTDRFRGSIDYWNFDYTNLIVNPESPQAIVENDCLDDGIPNDPRITRTASGQLNRVDSFFENVGAVETDGFDIRADYTMDMGGGNLIFNFASTYINKFDVDTDGDGIRDFDGAGSRNFRNNFRTMPQLRANLGATWLTGNHSVNLTARYIDSYKNDQSNDAKVDSWQTWDAQYSYTFDGLIGDGETTLTIGANNLTDEDPPALSRANADGTPVTRFRPDGRYNRGWIDRPGYDDRAGHDIRGRIVYFRFRHSF
jgi:iron complex outermembrane receptor protein